MSRAVFYKDIKEPTYYRTSLGNFGYIGSVSRTGTGPVTIEYASYYPKLQKWDEQFTTVVRNEEDTFGYDYDFTTEYFVKSQGVPPCPLAGKAKSLNVMVLRSLGKTQYHTFIPRAEMKPDDIEVDIWGLS